MTTLEDVWEELLRGRIYECSLRNSVFQVDGLQAGENVYVDPRPAILETLIHELLHRRFRTWSEKRVTHEANHLARSMDEATKQRWWRAYQRTKKKSRPVDA